MPNEIPQIQESQPILSPVNINSAGEGHEAFAKTLGSLSEAAGEQVVKIENEQSQSMYINSVANAEQIKTTAQRDMLENPNNSEAIAKRSADALDLIKQSAYVNKKDRSRLNAHITGTIDDIDLKSTATAVQQRQKEAAFTHYANLPDQLKVYQEALVKDHDKAEHYKEAMLANLHSLVSIGAITPHEAGSTIKIMQNTVDAANDMHRAGYGNPTAQDFHTLTSNPLMQNADNSNAPHNENSAWMINYFNNDKSLQGALADVGNRKLPDPATFLKLPGHDREHLIQAIQGTQIADGMINSGQPLPVIEHELQTLSEKNKVLSYREQATRNALSTYVQDLKNGNYLNVISRTPAGARILQDFSNNDAAIRNSPIDDNKKSEMILQNKNNMVSQAASYGPAHHIPSNLIKPIPSTEISLAESAFTIGQDPSVVLQVMGQYNKQNQAYLAQSMKTPEQQMIVHGLSLSAGDVSSSDQLAFVAANQTGRSDFNHKQAESGSKAISDNNLRTMIYPKLKEAMNVISQNYPPAEATRMQTAMLNTTVKAVRYYAQLDNNPTLENKSWYLGTTHSGIDDYINRASKFYGSSFQQKSSTNWIVNPKQLPMPMTNNQLDTLASYVINQGNDFNKNNLGEDRYNLMRGRAALKMVITPTGDVKAINSQGVEAYSVPFTTGLMEHAKNEVARYQKEEREREMKKSGNAMKRVLTGY